MNYNQKLPGNSRRAAACEFSLNQPHCQSPCRSFWKLPVSGITRKARGLMRARGYIVVAHKVHPDTNMVELPSHKILAFLNRFNLFRPGSSGFASPGKRSTSRSRNILDPQGTKQI